jgi:UDP-N-acetylmuramoyl-L-alanyl-D-glutamate--2,6-diaminopimelate ligase
MLLADILADIHVTGSVDRLSHVEGIAIRPDDVRPGYLFAACEFPWLRRPESFDVVFRKGAVAVLAQESLATDLVRSSVRDATIHINQAYARACANCFGNAHRGLTLYCVTGTKGKTTTCHLIEAVLRHAGRQTGLVSTLTQRTPRTDVISSVTTPERPIGCINCFVRCARRELQTLSWR